MIPGVMVDFLGRASVAVASTRSRDLIPHVRFVSGWYVEEDRDVLVCLVARGYTGGLAEALEDNGRFTLTAEVIGPHETYQFKGGWIGSRSVTEEDGQVHVACRQRFQDALSRHYTGRFTEHSMRGHIPPPELAVRFRVEEIFVQTPGPAAGQRLFPPSEPT